MAAIDIIELVALLVLLGLAAYLAAAETALLSASRVRVRKMVEDKVSGAQILENLLEQPGRFLPVILLLVLLVSFSAEAIMVALVERFLGQAVGVGLSNIIATVVLTIIVFIYAEIAPKTYSAQNAERVGLFTARPIDVLTRLLHPLVRVFIWAANLVIRVFGGHALSQGPFVTEEEIKTIVSVGEEEGVIEEEEKEMIHSIFEFTDTLVREVMVPRPDMICVETVTPLNEVLDLIIKEGHSRIPVFEETIDNVVGIVYAKDILVRLAKESAASGIAKEMMREAHYIPETKKVSELLRELQKKRQHMAIVLDEYGGTAGLVTIEDLLEEIVGEIFDEYDLEEKLVEPLADGVLRVDSRVPIDEFNEIMGTELPTEDVDSVGGLLYNLAGKIPDEGEVHRLDGVEFTVERLLGRRISKILVRRLPDREVAEEGEAE